MVRMVTVPRRSKTPEAEGKEKRDWVDQEWKVRVKAELTRRGWSLDDLADRIERSRSGIFRFLNTEQRSSAYVSLIEKELGVTRTPQGENATDPLRRRFDELSSKLSADDAALILRLMENMAAKKSE